MIDECLVVEFRVTGDDCPLAQATAAADATVEANPPQRRSDGNVLLRFSAEDDGRLAAELDADERVRYLHTSTTRGMTNYRCLSKHPCVVHELTDVGFMAETLRYRNGTETYTGAVVGHDVLQGVLEAAGETVGVTLERIYPLREDDDGTVTRRWSFTPAQEEALRAALDAGYFTVPREATASDVAATLDISKSAFLERLRRGLGELLRDVFEDSRRTDSRS
jgi:predicted DNA binding protein